MPDLDVNTNIFYYFPWINNKVELICCQQHLSKNIWDSAWSWQKMELLSQEKNIVFKKAEKQTVVWVFIYVLVWTIYFPSMERISRKKNIFNLLVSRLDSILSFHFLLADKWNLEECQVSFFEAQCPALCPLWYLKNVCTVFQFSLVVYCVCEQMVKAKIYLFL